VIPSSQIVLVGDVPAGHLQVDRQGATAFRLLESYRSSYPRPVLGQQFLDHPDDVFKSRQRLPRWFSNLLPEGALRELVAKKLGATLVNEYALLHQLRDDLPGNVRLLDEEGSGAAIDVESESPPKLDADEDTGGDWKFSLAGVQLKFSAFKNDQRGLTIPVTGRGGDWIVKLPDQRFAGVPANEFATMSWARASGIEVPDFELIDVSSIAGHDAVLATIPEPKAFAVRRFDRPTRDQRIHIEDFAQIVDVYPEDKYGKANYEQLAKLVLAIAPRPSFEAFIRRLVFVLASGNGDAHLKNWSFIYRDGASAELSPAYDLVSTIQYMNEDGLALNLGGSKRWEDVSMATFERLARKIRFEAEQGLSMVRLVEQAKAAILDAWASDAKNFGFTKSQRTRVDRHLRTIALFQA
jgi:serine/threonine-protein kinase HipA